MNTPVFGSSCDSASSWAQAAHAEAALNSSKTGWFCSFAATRYPRSSSRATIASEKVGRLRCPCGRSVCPFATRILGNLQDYFTVSSACLAEFLCVSRLAERHSLRYSRLQHALCDECGNFGEVCRVRLHEEVNGPNSSPVRHRRINRLHSGNQDASSFHEGIRAGQGFSPD